MREFKPHHISEALIRQYEPKESWLRHDSSLHGIGHLSRVFILQELLCDLLETQGVKVNRTVTRWAAITHDVGRLDDGLDLDHGTRSAEWIVDNLEDEMTPEIMDAVTHAVHWHVPPDSEAPVMTPELKVLKDADGLDRVRLGDFNPSYLRITGAENLVDVAQNLYDFSQTQSSSVGGESFKDVLEAAKSLGLTV